MRVAIAISFLAIGFILPQVRADTPFVQVDAGGAVGYIVPGPYAAASKPDFVASIPGDEEIKGFWTPTETDVRMADRILHQTLKNALKDPTLLFPDLASKAGEASSDELEHQRNELSLVLQNFAIYGRQYVGIIVDGHKLIFCNYSDVKNVDFSTYYISIEKYFATDGVTHFLQCRFNVEERTCGNVSMIGPWITKGEALRRGN